ncbi:MAG: branched-chain amino acid ABC transporter substrate-binding protein [Nitrospirae bacterium]|nr:branched-chain amino acid ABC transporter substrate-binding protein [Nitrospirota bacterium]
MKRILTLFFCLCLLTAIIAGCQKKGPDVIKVGVVGPMTGDQSRFGTDFKNGVTLAADQWNEKGGLLGKKIELVIGDDQHDPKQAVSVANKIVNGGAVGIIGHFNSSCSIPASDVYNRASVPMISPASTNPELTQKGYKGTFRVCGRDDQQGGVGAAFVVSSLKLKKVAVIHDKTTYGQGLADEFKKALSGKVEVVYYGGIVQGDKDFKSVLTSIKAKSPELIFFGGIYPEMGLLVRQAKELGLKAPFMSGDGSYAEEFVKIAGDQAAEGTYLTFSPDPNNIPDAKDFITKYNAKFGKEGPYSIYAFDAANILFTAIRDANTTDGKTVIDKLHSLEFNGAMGKIKLNENGDVTAPPYVVWTTKNGKFVEVWKP